MARKATKTPAGPRASWRGMLKFGLVSFPVQAFNAHSAEGGHVAFHQLHAECHNRIRYVKECPVHGPVSQDEIVSGYEYHKGHNVEIDPDELDEMRTDAEKALTIDAFVTPDEIDTIYRDGRMYFLAPDGAQAREPYSVFLDALEEEGRHGVGQVVFSGKQQVVVVRPYQEALLMEMLNYEKEIRNADDVVPAATKGKHDTKMLRLARQLISSWSDERFDYSQYVDEYDEKVRDFIEAKVAGKKVVAPESDEEEPEVINLLDALRKSVAKPHTAHTKAHKAKPARRRHSTKHRPTHRRAS